MNNSFVMRFFRGSEKNIQKDCFIWNTIAGLMNAAEAIVFMMIVTRTNGVEAAGILSIAFAVGNLLMTIGKFGVRNYQATDVKAEFSFNTYFTLRVFSGTIMAVFTIGYVLINVIHFGYSAEKAGVIAGICFIYIIESFEDVFLGHFQIKNRLDVASKVFVCRWGLIMAVFSIYVIAKRDLVTAVWLSVLLSAIVEILLLLIATKIVVIPEVKVDLSGCGKLTKQCFALFLAAFLTYYVTNAPKYAIDRVLTEDIQAYYGYISMPVFVIELLNCFLYQPQIVGLAEAWNNKNLKLLKQKELRQFLIIAVLTIICVSGAYVLGIPILSLLYGVNLSEFKTELLVLMTAGGALAFVGYTGILLTVMRKQRLLLYNMLIVTALAICGFEFVVKNFEMFGAALYYLILMVILAVLNYVCIVTAEMRYIRIKN